jgi:uncharacterized membrane protein YphA (DoxX/SURF4 family)
MQKIVPGLVWYRPFEPYAYVFIRFCSGAIFITHGVDRPFYGRSAAELGFIGKHVLIGLIGGFECIGGLMLAMLLTRPVAVLFACLWIIIAFPVPLDPANRGSCFQLVSTTRRWLQ